MTATPQMPKPPLSLAETAERLGVPVLAIHRLVLDNRVPVIDLGGRRFIDVKYLEIIGRMLIHNQQANPPASSLSVSPQRHD